MPTVEKIIEKMKNQPNGIKFSEAEKVLSYLGFVLDRQKGSHKTYVSETSSLTLPEQNPLKKVYVQSILNLI